MRLAGFLMLLLSPPLLLAQNAPPSSLADAQSLLDSGKLSEAETSVRQYISAHRSSADADYLLAYILFKEDKPKLSLDEYAEAARLRSPAAIDLEVIGSDYFLMENYTEADVWLSKSVADNGRSPLALYLLGRTKYNEEHFEEAARLFKECLKLDSKNAKAATNLGLSYEKLGRTEDAVEAYKSAISFETDRNSGEAGPYLDLGSLLVGSNRAGEALPYLTKAAAIDGEDARAHRELGMAYLLLNQLEAAQTELEKAAELDPESGPTHFLLARAYKKRGLVEKARSETDRYNALTGTHSSPDDPLAEARSLIGLGKLNQAEDAIRRYLIIHRNSADAHFLLGYVLFCEQKATASLSEYTEGAKYRTPSAHDLEVVGGDYVLLRDYTDADKWFSKSVEWDPANFQTIYYLGRTKYNENRFQEAAQAFEKCLKLDPKSVKAEDNLGLTYAAMGRTDEAVAAYKSAISWQINSKAKDSGPYVDLGTLLVDNERAGEAVSYLLEALAIAPRDFRAHRELGKAYMHLNQLVNAQSELEKSAQLAPQNAPIHFMLAQVYRKRGLTEKAKLEAERYTALAGTHSADLSQ